MYQVIISLAANRFQKKNLSKARRCLEEIFFDLRFTSECWTDPVGSTPCRDAYLNQLAIGNTALDEPALTEWLKKTELSFGRTEAKRQSGIVPIDLDILDFNGEKRHLRDWERPYVLQLIKELMPKNQRLQKNTKQ